MNPGQSRQALEATENENTEGENPENEHTEVALVKRFFEADVKKRAVNNTAAEVPCPCGQYQYFSQKCGHLYKRVHLKCGNNISNKRGEPILCPAGRLRRVNVETAKVPYYCPACRQSGRRWTTDAVTNDQPRAEQEGEDRSTSLVGRKRERPESPGDPSHQTPKVTNASPAQLYNALPARGRDEKENVKAGPKGSKGSKDGEEAED